VAVVRTILVIGIGMGDPDRLTLEAVDAMRRVDVFFAIDKATNRADDGDASDLVRARRALCEHHLAGRPYRFVTIDDPPRERDAPGYRSAVEAWHTARADRYLRTIEAELGPDGCGGILVWGDPSLYDSTLRILDQVVRQSPTPFVVEVIPGVSSLQLLAARHRIGLNRIGGSVLVTTGRNLAAGVPDGVDDVVVMLDGACAFRGLDADAWHIHWGAYLGTDDELLVAGPLAAVADEIVRVREEARRRKGWVMDTYLLRRRTSADDDPEPT
jgi:precorrin-6A synthase